MRGAASISFLLFAACPAPNGAWSNVAPIDQLNPRGPSGLSRGDLLVLTDDRIVGVTTAGRLVDPLFSTHVLSRLRADVELAAVADLAVTSNGHVHLAYDLRPAAARTFGAVVDFDPKVGPKLLTDAPLDPSAIAVAHDERFLFISDASGDSSAQGLWQYDLATGRTERVYEDAPMFGVAVTNGGLVYAATENRIVAFDPARGQRWVALEVEGFVHDLAPTARGVVVSSIAGTRDRGTVWSLGDDGHKQATDVDAPPFAIAARADRVYVYLAGRGLARWESGSISVVSEMTAEPTAMTVDRFGDVIVGDAERGLLRIDTEGRVRTLVGSGPLRGTVRMLIVIP